MSSLFYRGTLAFLLCLLGACGSLTAEKPEPVAEVPEIRPGILQGYLPMNDPLESVIFVPASPAENAARQQLDNAISKRALALRGTPRWALATHDAHLGFPDAADTFSCALDLPITEAETPALYMLLRRTLADVGLATYSAKNAYQRPRPFMANGQPTCTPEEEEMLRSDGSYPSGHTSIGWGWALILAELAPERAETILDRGKAFGESRIVCNVHWYSDVVAGRMVAAGAVATLHANPEFQAAMKAAKAEISTARERGLTSPLDCAAEQEALSSQL
ncbi:MAG: phosphatase PAP2 family protein [Halioglobus sp.]|jgi:acid phosphatase (class A)